MRIFLLIIFFSIGYSQTFAKSSTDVLYMGNSAENSSEQSEYEMSDLSKLNDELKKINYENTVLKESNNREKLFRYSIIIFFLITLFILVMLTFTYHRKQKYYKSLYYQKVTIREIEITDQNEEVIPKHDENLNELQGLSPIIVENILSYLDVFENKKKFLIKEASLLTMAKECGTNTTYLSKVINHYKKNNFASYLNELRLNHAVELWKNKPKLRYQSIQGMADMVGFNTAQSFSKKFHEKYNISPTHFLKDLIRDTQKNDII